MKSTRTTERARLDRLASVNVDSVTVAVYARDAGGRKTGLAYGNGTTNGWEYRSVRVRPGSAPELGVSDYNRLFQR